MGPGPGVGAGAPPQSTLIAIRAADRVFAEVLPASDAGSRDNAASSVEARLAEPPLKVLWTDPNFIENLFLENNSH